jgi:hypothetical protein
MNLDPANLIEYLPMRFTLRDGVPEVQWCYVGSDRLTEPFFDHSIEGRLQSPFNAFFQPRTSVDTLAEFARCYGMSEPAGFVFHLSRCGSTLITQMLGSLPQNVVLSEPSPVDSILRARLRDPQVTENQQAQWLRSMIGALGHSRRPEECRVFLKLDCWHVIFLPLLRKAFPNVPFVFLYRDPVEIMVSHMHRRGAQMLPGIFQPELYGIRTQDAISMTAEEYCARVLAVICQAGLDHQRDDPMLLLNYRQLPAVVWEDLAAYFQIENSPAEVEQMRGAARYDAKQPSVEFATDSARKRSSATPEIIKECVERLEPLYRQLEAARIGVAR